LTLTGTGGSSPFGAGGKLSLSTGGNGLGYGGGGGGGTSFAGDSGAFGGNGANGVIVVTEYISGGAPTVVAGTIVNSVYAEAPTASTTVAMAGAFNTVPQQTDGSQFLVATLTPQKATNKLRIRLTGAGSSALANTHFWVALFKDAAGPSIGATPVSSVASDTIIPFSLETEVAAGSTSAVTIKARLGNFQGNSQVVFLGGTNIAGAFFGGSTKQTLVVEEIAQ